MGSDCIHPNIITLLRGGHATAVMDIASFVGVGVSSTAYCVCSWLPVAAAPSGGADVAEVPRAYFKTLMGALSPLPIVCRTPGEEEPHGGDLARAYNQGSHGRRR